MAIEVHQSKMFLVMPRTLYGLSQEELHLLELHARENNTSVDSVVTGFTAEGIQAGIRRLQMQKDNQRAEVQRITAEAAEQIRQDVLGDGLVIQKNPAQSAN